jgi:hypothetical protein
MSSVSRNSYSTLSQPSFRIGGDKSISESRKLFTSSARELPENRPAMLLTAVYSGDEQKVYLKFYDEEDQSILHKRNPKTKQRKSSRERENILLKDQRKRISFLTKKSRS